MADILKVNLPRLLAWIEELAEIGKKAEGGIYRMALNSADMLAREWFKRKAEELGLTFWQDGAYNIGAVLAGSDKNEPHVLAGSHLDTVPCAGKLDGALGVLVALEALARIKELGLTPRRSLEAVSFTDEEGRFGAILGSKAFCGLLDPQILATARDSAGVLLADAIAHLGGEPANLLKATRDKSTLHTFLEVHIEQGPILEREQCDIGIVFAITGISKWNISFLGQANHAGTTPMEARRDAMDGFASFASQVKSILKSVGTENSRCNIGKVIVKPGASNIIPEEVEFSFEFRDPAATVMNALEEAYRSQLEQLATHYGLGLNLTHTGSVAPQTCAPEIVDLLEQVSKECNLTFRQLPSGGGHDCQNLATLVPSGMIFIPSQNAISHNPLEHSLDSDIENGANVLLNALVRLAN